MNNRGIESHLVRATATGVSPRLAALARQTQLFVPANRPERVVKAALVGASAIVIDLEDSIPAEARAEVREFLGPMVADVRDARPGAYVVVRVNADDTQFIDMHSSVAAGVDAILLPKVASSREVITAEAQLDDIERDMDIEPGTIELQLLVESAAGLLHLPQIASTGQRTVAMMLGTEDLSTDLEIDPRSEHFDIRWAHGLLIAAARANGIAPYGLLRTLSEFRDLNALKHDAEKSRAFGYVGTLCIHPAQVDILNKTFRPSDEEVQRARLVLEAMSQAHTEGRAAVQLDGTMLDTPMVRRAERILLRADQGVS